MNEAAARLARVVKQATAARTSALNLRPRFLQRVNLAIDPEAPILHARPSLDPFCMTRGEFAR
jgi:hypothetical protein